MRRVILTLAAGLVALFPALAWVDRRADCPEPPPLKHSFTRWEAESKLKIQGVGSCAAAACHGGPGRGVKGSEYSTFAALDPHAKAFGVLYNPESKRMHQILGDAFPEMRKHKAATENPLCLKCHGMGPKVEARYQADGVGCDRCHGPAEKWRTTHYLDEFDRRSPGFVDMRCDFAARAFACTKCHVGESSQEVDHVLIAAGHPRLRFEFAAYYGNYPRHWEALGEKEVDPTFEAFNWALGQLVTARAALDLLVARASDPEREKNWPEFSEYDCTSCHHDLKKRSGRQDYYLGLADRGIVPKQKKVGELPWGTWYYPLLPVLKRHVIGAPKGVEANLAALDQLMRRREPPRGEARRLAERLRDQLDGWIETLVQAQARTNKAVAVPAVKEKVVAVPAQGVCAAARMAIVREQGVRKVRQNPGARSFTDAELRAIVKDLASQRVAVQQGWDGGTQVYLGLASMNQALGDADADFAAKQPFRDPLTRIRVGLKKSFEPNARIPDRTRTLYDTPNDYFNQLKDVTDGLDGFRKPKK
jgi:hypothetical protein